MNNQMPVTANVTTQKNLDFVDISKGKVLATDQNTHGKVLGVAEASKVALEKVAVFGVSSSVQTTAPVETAQPVEQPKPTVQPVSQPIPEPQAVQPAAIPTEGQQVVLENPVLSVEPVSVNASMSELNTPVDVTSLPGQIVEDVKAAIPEPQPLSQVVDVGGNQFNIENQVSEKEESVEKSTAPLPVLDVPAIESAVTEQPTALEPVGVNNQLFEEKPVAEAPAEPVAEAPAEPVAETPAVPVVETPAVPVVETQAESEEQAMQKTEFTIPNSEIENEIDGVITHIKEGSSKAIEILSQLKEKLVNKEAKDVAEVNSLVDEGMDKIAEASSTQALTTDISLPVLDQIIPTVTQGDTPTSLGM